MSNMTNNPTSWITGLMRENYETVGFLPETTVHTRYVQCGRYVLQKNEHGRRVGYLLYGPVSSQGVVCVTQHVIQEEKRGHGYGELAWHELLRRCLLHGADTIRLHCATSFPSLMFWQQMGFTIYANVPGGTHRGRTIACMAFDCGLPLFAQKIDVLPRLKSGDS